MVSVTLEHVTKRFGAVTAVADVSLEVAAGELFFLLGPSGCGKTTLLRILAGLERQDAGAIHFGDTRVDDVPPNRRNTAMVFQDYALWPHMTVTENVVFGLEARHVPRGERKVRVEKVLDMARVSELASRRPGELSGGQQQRVALARALVTEPDVVLLDEPLSNLDARLRRQMRNEIRRIHDEAGVTTVYVTHDQAEALSMADRIAVMECGLLSQVGTPRALYRRPATAFVASFVGQTNLLPGKVTSVAASTAVVATELGAIAASFADGDIEVGSQALISIRPEAIGIASGGQASPTLVVLGRTYEGAVDEFVLATDGGAEIVVRQFNLKEEIPSVGDRVRVVVDPDSAVVVKP